MEQKLGSNQEVDLLKLMAKTFRVLKKNFILVIICPAFGLLSGFLFVKFFRPNLTSNLGESSLMIATNLLTKDEADYLCDTFTSADSTPGLSKQQRKSIIKLSYEIGKQERDETFVKLKATVAHHYILAVLQNSLIDYLSRSEPLVRQRNQKIKYYQSMIEKLDEELNELDSIKRNGIEKFRNVSSNPFSQSVELYERRLACENALEAKVVYVVQGFTPEAPLVLTSNPKTIYVITGFIIGCVLLLMILFAKYFLKYYKSLPPEEKQ